MTKKWYVREKNSSRYISGEWIFYKHDNIWTDNLTDAKAWRTKKEATAFSSDILKRGEVYGE